MKGGSKYIYIYIYIYDENEYNWPIRGCIFLSPLTNGPCRPFWLAKK
jgi:hypothetical protein